MPNRDGTGPNGQGPRTGRQQGNCKDAEPQENRPIRGRGIGAGRRPRGAGRGQGQRIGRGRK